jgi:Cu-Zn family superoxide dismutase
MQQQTRRQTTRRQTTRRQTTRRQTTRKQQKGNRGPAIAVAVFRGGPVEGTAVARREGKGTTLSVEFTKLPKGKHGFHIHRAGDLRGTGCQGACEHFHVGPPCRHGAGPHTAGPRHSGDLGNLPSASSTHPFRHTYRLPQFPPETLWGRTLIVHEKEDDLGRGNHPDSGTTGHSGARIGCAIFGRIATCLASK